MPDQRNRPYRSTRAAFTRRAPRWPVTALLVGVVSLLPRALVRMRTSERIVLLLAGPLLMRGVPRAEPAAQERVYGRAELGPRFRARARARQRRRAQEDPPRSPRGRSAGPLRQKPFR